MSCFLPFENKNHLPKLGEQDGNEDPIVYDVFSFPMSRWTWFATEGEEVGDDFRFFGYVVGFESEWGYFSFSELESVDINGIRVWRDESHVPRSLSVCLKQYGTV